MSDSIRQWHREYQLVIGKGGSGLIVEELRVTFEVKKTVEPTPNEATIKIYNLNPDNEARVKNEFDEVLLNAGYEGGQLLIFRGNIKHVYRYREGNDFITEIEAADGDKDFTRAVMNTTLAAGTTTDQLVDGAVSSFSGVGGTIKGVIQSVNKARIRGKVISGNTKDVLHREAKNSNVNWSIQDGQLTMVSVDGVLPGEAIVITSETGLLGSPEVNDKGIAAKCLLNPQIKINGAVYLDNNTIKAKHEKDKALGDKKEKQGEPVRLDPDGIYKVIKLTHKGDSRGADWYSEVTCIGLNQPIPKKSKK